MVLVYFSIKIFCEKMHLFFGSMSHIEYMNTTRYQNTCFSHIRRKLVRRRHRKIEQTQHKQIIGQLPICNDVMSVLHECDKAKSPSSRIYSVLKNGVQIHQAQYYRSGMLCRARLSEDIGGNMQPGILVYMRQKEANDLLLLALQFNLLNVRKRWD